ncbi:MAG: hypothetical protein K8T91_04905 [Planctomycetes bacterium]|nr:hypothetical protein [Planctomycetota bacterium]
MTPPRFQFTIRGLLWATFWAAVALAAFTSAGPLRAAAEKNGDATYILCQAVAVCGAAVSLSTLFNRARQGIMASLVIMGMMAIIALGGWRWH